MSHNFRDSVLGLLAIAGYQNRDKIAELLRGAQGKPLPLQVHIASIVHVAAKARMHPL